MDAIEKTKVDFVALDGLVLSGADINHAVEIDGFTLATNHRTALRVENNSIGLHGCAFFCVLLLWRCC